MPIMVKKSSGDFVPCPPGTWPAVCVDVVDLGPVHNEWKGEMVHKIRLVWQINERMPDGRPYIVQRMYTASLHEKSSLRKDLASWRGMDFRPEELAGFDLENVLGVGCLLSVVQQIGNDGQTYSNVSAVMRLPGGYEAPQPDGYVRVIHRDQGGGMLPAPRQQQPQQGFQQPSYRRQPQPPPATRGIQPQFQQPQPAHDAGAWPQQRGAMQNPAPPNQQYQPPDHQEITDDDIPF